MFGAIIAIIVGQKQEKRRRNFAVITGHADATGSNVDFSKNTQKNRAEIAKKLKEASQDKKKAAKNKMSLRRKMQQAGMDAPISHYWIGCVIFTVLVALGLSMTDLSGAAKSFFLFTAFFGLPRFFLKFKAKRRQKKFMLEFADALDAMTRLLQSGMPVSEAIAMVSREFTGPVGEEMQVVYDEQRIGTPLGEAVLRTAERMPLTEVKMFATAIQIQTETGSSLSEVLTNLSSVIRSRFQLQRKVKALSSEAKASASIIGCLPLLVALGLYAVNPDYIALLFTTPKGKLMTTGAVIWMSLGVFMMKQMINFKV